VATPRRSRVLSAKLTAGLVAGLVFAAAAVGLALGSLILSAGGIPSSLDGGEVALLAGGGLAGIALRGAFGVGLGAIIRNQVGAVALMGLKTAHLLSPAAGGAVLVGWTLTLSLAGLVLTKRRDVP